MITSIQNTQNYTQNTQKVNNSNATNKASFGEVLGETQKEEKKYESKFLQSLGEGALDKFSEEKKRLIRDIFADDKITMNEIKNLNYEDKKDILRIVFTSIIDENSNVQKDNPLQISAEDFIIMADIDYTSNLTNDKAFNQAYAQFRNNPNLTDSQKSRITIELEQQLTQSYFNEEVQISTVASLNPKTPLNPWEMNKDKINIDAFFDEVFNMLNNWLSKPNIVPEFKKDVEFLNSAYSNIYENYQKIKNRPVEIYS